MDVGEYGVVLEVKFTWWEKDESYCEVTTSPPLKNICESCSKWDMSSVSQCAFVEVLLWAMTCVDTGDTEVNGKALLSTPVTCVSPMDKCTHTYIISPKILQPE